MSFETPENMDKCCNTCRWNEPFNGVCYNADSPHRAIENGDFIVINADW